RTVRAYLPVGRHGALYRQTGSAHVAPRLCCRGCEPLPAPAGRARRGSGPDRGERPCARRDGGARDPPSGGQMIRINLLPGEEAERAAGRRENLALGTLVFGVAMAGLVAAHLWQGIRSSATHREMSRVQGELKAIEGPYADALRIEQQKQELREKLRVIGQLEAKKVGPVRILADLSSATPDKLWLT